MEYPVTKILIIRFSSIGDILLTTPALRALRRWSPEAEIHFVLKREFADLLQENPNIDRIVPWDPSTGPAGLFRLGGQLRGHYDLVVDLHRSLRSILLRTLVGATRRVTYPKGVVRRFLMIRTGRREFAMKEPIPERYLLAIEPLGAVGDGEGIDFPISDEARERAIALLMDASKDANIDSEVEMGCRPYLAIAPGAKWATKRWLPERFAEVADRLADRFGLVPVLLGHRDEEEITGAVRDEMKHPVIDLTGRLDLPKTGAVLAMSRLLICNDSGVMHMAAALCTPLVAVFGPTTRELGFIPYRAEHRLIGSDIPCRPCHHLGGERCPKGHHRCMTDVTVEEVVEAASAYAGAAPIPEKSELGKE
jgi:heptosyltransferase-2